MLKNVHIHFRTGENQALYPPVLPRMDTHSSERLGQLNGEWCQGPHTTNLFLARVLLLVAVSAWAWYPMMVFVESPKRSL